MSALAARGHEVRALAAWGRAPPYADVRAVDVFHVQRYVDGGIEGLIRDAKRHGVAVSWDEDDDFGAVPKDAKVYAKVGGLKWEKRLAAMKRIFRLVDVVTTPSPVLAERLRSYGARHVEVIDNHVPAMFLEARRREHAGITVGWVAGSEHHLDVERLPIVDVLKRLLADRPEVRVMSLGVRLPLDPARYEHIPVVRLIETETEQFSKHRSPLNVHGRARGNVSLGRLLPGGIANYAARFDIGIAPLADIALNRSRSSIKLKEYAAGGTPWLASPVGPYLGMGEKQGGRLVADEDWYEELVRLVDSARLRRKLAKNATKWVLNETIERNVGAWEDTLEEAMERASSPAVASYA
jgi:glycosyltransferase involved in cell wall biosynthesis